MLKWELILAGRPVRAGKLVAILEMDELKPGQRLVLKDGETGDSDRFVIYSSISIGGRDYLLLREAKSADIVVARHVEKDSVMAMDPDRFSSLRNALLTFLEHAESSKPLGQ